MDYAQSGLVYDAAQSELFMGVGMKFRSKTATPEAIDRNKRGRDPARDGGKFSGIQS